MKKTYNQCLQVAQTNKDNFNTKASKFFTEQSQITKKTNDQCPITSSTTSHLQNQIMQ